MVDADTIKRTIEELGRIGEPFRLSEVAQILDLANWEEIMEPIQLVAEVMVQQGVLHMENDEVTYVGNTSRKP